MEDRAIPASTTLAPSPVEEGSAGTPAPPPTSEGSGGRARRRALLAVGVVISLYGLWVASLQYFAYTSDAVVAADVVFVASEVDGRIAAVHVTDNEFVRRGRPLFEIDPAPYALEADLRAAELTKAQADEQYAVRAVERARADLGTQETALAFSRRTEQRYDDLVRQGAVSQLAYDEAKTRRIEAESKRRAISAALDEAEQAVAAHRATVEVARRALDRARWELEQTRLVAPVDGQINNMWMRIGDYARHGEPRLGIVAEDRWWVVALYKEEVIRHLSEGQRVWIQLDIYPWRILRGRVQGIARGIAREDGQTEILPRIAATTGWIRFQRRVPVRIVLEDVPEDVRLHSGVNARTLVVYDQ